ncbi:MAG: hypothetical protein QM699_16335 [Amaricoccus sp.]|uniref:hypothetical protein n=1 Tax=Amaricoccus sp. TaxID=1872485 RepID=UPI0039E30B49
MKEAFIPNPFRALALAAALAALPQLSAAQTVAETNATLDQLYGEHAPYQAFFGKLQKAVAADDKATVAGLVSYPFETQVGGKKVTLRDAHHFVAAYDKIVTPKVKKALAAQEYASISANSRGVMVGDGEIWFSGLGDTTPATVFITAINQ